MSDKRVLSKDDILGLGEKDREFVEVEVPEWGEGCIIRLRSLSAGEMMEFTKALENPATKNAGIIRAFIASACDEEGNLLFTTRDQEMLKARSVKILKRLQEAILDLNDLWPEDEKRKREKDAERGND